MSLNPTRASRLELPSVAGVKKLVEDSLVHDWILCIAHIGSVPGKTVRAQWQQWGESMFAVSDASSARFNQSVSSLADGGKSIRGAAWKVVTVAGMLLASLLMLEEVVA
jgi:hypothetical protein